MTIITTYAFLYIFLALIVVFIVLIFLVNYRHFKKIFSIHQDSILGFKKELPISQHRAIFVDLSPKSADLVELAVEVWRINNRVMKAGNDLPEIQRRGLESSLQKFIKFLDRYGIIIIDHTGEKYNEGLNVDVLSFEKDPNVKIPLIKETVEPSISCKGHIVKKGKVIVINN